MPKANNTRKPAKKMTATKSTRKPAKKKTSDTPRKASMVSLSSDY